MKKICILMNIFFNYDLIERTLQSIQKNIEQLKITDLFETYTVDIIFLENPSKYSYKIYEIGKKYNIRYHFITNKNIEFQTFELFTLHYKNILDIYDYICITESDVVLENFSLYECISILEKYKDSIQLCSIDINTQLDKYRTLPVEQWVEKHNSEEKEYNIGRTGLQFIAFTHSLWFECIYNIRQECFSSYISLGIDDFKGFSDVNLGLFTQKNNYIWAITKYNKLDHIGWELFLDKNKQHEYILLRNKLIKNGCIRKNHDLNTCFFHKLHMSILLNPDSIDKLRYINNTIDGKHFHEHTVLLYDIFNIYNSIKKIVCDRTHYLEIGSFLGSSACLILTNDNVNITCIDPFNLPLEFLQVSNNNVYANQMDVFLRNIHMFNHKNRDTNIEIIQSLSDDVDFDKQNTNLINNIDILFIDGNHSYSSVIQDWKIYSSIVKKGGFIIFDDYFDFEYSPEVYNAVNDIVFGLDKDKYEIIGSLYNVYNASPLYSDELRIHRLNEFILKVK